MHGNRRSGKIERLKEASEPANSPGDDPSSWVAEAAYYKAEKRGFEPGFEEKDWIEAENEILGNGKIG